MGNSHKTRDIINKFFKRTVMIKRMQYLMLICFLFSGNTFGQQSEINSMKVGEVVPNVTIKNVQNYFKEEVDISDFKGKLLILDFWGLNCAPCIEAFPKLDSLQKKFKDRIQILLVTKDSKPVVDSIYKLRSPRSSSLRFLPRFASIAGDTIFHKLFEYISLPHSVWISPTGKVRAITAGKYVTENNIERILTNNAYQLPLKYDKLVKLEEGPVFPQIFPFLQDKLRFYTTLSHSIGAYGSQAVFAVDSLAGTVRITRGNTTVLRLCAESLTGNISVGDPFETYHFDFGKRVELNTSDSSRFFYKGNDANHHAEWIARNRYHYETVLPLMTYQKTLGYMKMDIDKFFGIKSYIEKRKMNCIVLVRTSERDRIKYIPEKDTMANGARNAGVDVNGAFHINGMTLTTLVRNLSSDNKSTPFAFLDQTNYKGKVFMKIDAPLSNLPLVKKELRDKYDLDLVEREEEVDFMVISDQ